jgi:hypothetical protein
MNAPTQAPKRARLAKRAAAGVGLLALVALATAYGVLRTDPLLEPLPAAPLPAAASVAAIPSSMPKQAPNQCGAYSLAFALRTHGEAADPKALAALVWHDAAFDALSGTLPWRIEAQLEQRGLTSQACSARAAPRERRLDLLRAHLAAGTPVILLIESERGMQHYVVALGYAAADVHIYDPNAEAADDPASTRDQNGTLPGNLSVPADTLLAQWERGGGGGLYTWWYLPVARAAPPGG